MSSKAARGSHDRLKEAISPIHEEIGRVTAEIDKLRSEKAILQAIAISELGEVGLSDHAIGSLAAACW